MPQVLDSINNSLTSLLQNAWFANFVSLFLILYISFAKPDLSLGFVTLFENTFFRLFVLFCIAYIASRNITLSILMAIAFAVSMSLVSEIRLKQGFASDFKY